MRKLLLPILVSLLPLPMLGAVHVTPTGSGDNSGSDWSNACAGFSGACAPSGLVRGETYYVADGTYSTNLDFSTAESGTTVITIKKCTETEHGSETGFTSDLCDGQARFNANWTVSTDYWVFDGQVQGDDRFNPDVWNDTNQYGFRLRGADGSNSISVEASHLAFKYLDIGADEGTLYPEGMPTFCFRWVASDMQNEATWFDDILVHRVYCHNVIMPIQSRGTRGVTIEYVFFGPSWGKEVIAHQHGHDWIIRQFWWRDNGLNGSESMTAEIGNFQFTPDSGGANANNWQIYSGIIEDTDDLGTMKHNDAVILSGSKGWKVYNLTLVNLGENRDDILISSNQSNTGNEVYNILFAPVEEYEDQQSGSTVQVQIGESGGTASHMWCQQHPLGHRGGHSCDKLANDFPNTISNGNDPYVDLENHDFELNPDASGTLPIDNGKALGDGFNDVDLKGRTRGADGAWDIGALEFTGNVEEVDPPANLDTNVD